MTPDEQLAEWLKGNSICPNDRDECCPDFSCCQPELLASKESRQAFINADEELRMTMLGMFLGNAMSKAAELKDLNVYIAGVDEPDGLRN